MNNLCEITQPHYLRALLQLLPRGYAWEWDANSSGRRVLAVVAEELTRLHQLLCGIAHYNIDRFTQGVTGWSAPDYERLLKNNFGIDAVVTDGLQPFNCESSCEDALLDERIVYVYVITVDDLSVITPSVLAYLREYQQSHTHYHIRDRMIVINQNENTRTLNADWSWANDDLSNLIGWDMIALSQNYTYFRRDDASY